MNILEFFKKHWVRHEYEQLRCPERTPKCYEMTEEEKQQAIVKLNRNVWNDYHLSKQDHYRA